MNNNKLILIIIFCLLSFGFNNQSLARNDYANKSEIQKSTIHSHKKAIYPENYLTKDEISPKKAEKETFLGTLGKIVRALFLAIALFCGLAAFLYKKKDSLRNLNINWNYWKKSTPSVDKIAEEFPQQTTTSDEKIPEQNESDIRIKNLVFKFFEINNN